jgi:hypothetical protein
MFEAYDVAVDPALRIQRFGRFDREVDIRVGIIPDPSRRLSQHTQFPFSDLGHKLSVTPHTPVFSHLKNSCDH